MNRVCKTFLLAVAALSVLSCQSCGQKSKTTAGNGSKIAFATVSGIGIYHTSGGEITYPVSGSNIYRLIFSPDGNYLFFKKSSDLFCLDIASGKEKLAAPNADPVCYKDDLMICVSESNGITAYNPKTGENTQLVPKPENGYIALVLFSNDRSRMLYSVCMKDVGKVITLSLNITIPGSEDIDTLSPEAVSGEVGKLSVPLCWAADGSSFLVKYGYSDASRMTVYAYPIIEGSPSSLGKKPLSIAANADFRVSADGSHAVVPAFQNVEDALETIALINLKSLGFSYIPSGSDGLSGLDISSDATMIAYASGSAADGSQTQGIYIYSNNVTLKLCGGDGMTYASPAFSSDGRTLYFIGLTDGDGDLYSASTNSAGCKKLFGGVAPPDGIYTSSWRDMFAVYDKPVSEQQAGAKVE